MADQEDLASIIQSFIELHDGTAAILSSFGHDPIAGSIAARELTCGSCIERLKCAHSQGSLLIEVADDQIAAFVRGISQPILTIAPWTNTRGALEATAISIWLLDDRIQPNGSEEAMLSDVLDSLNN